MGQFGIGQPIKRFEDQRLLRGEGRFHDDVNLPGQTHAVIVRSTHAHARIRSIDTAAALASPGVVAVFTGADLARDNLGTMQMTLKRKRPDGSPMFAPPHRGLTAGPRPLRRRPRGHGHRRDPGPGRGRGGAAPDRLRAPALRDLDGVRPSAGPRSGTSAPTMSRTSSSPATRRRPTRRSRRRTAWCAAATSSPASTRSTWSRAGRSASGTRARSATRSTPTCSIPIGCGTRSPTTSSRSPSTASA